MLFSLFLFSTFPFPCFYKSLWWKHISRTWTNWLNVRINYFFLSLKDAEKSSRDGGDQEKTIKRSKMSKVNMLYLYFKSLYLLVYLSVLVILLFLYCNHSKFCNHNSARPFTTFEAPTLNRNCKTLFKIFESTSERVNILKRRLVNIQSIFQELVPEEQKSIILEQHFSEQSLLKTFQWLHL